MIIGLAGTFGAGKDTVADYLVNKGFQHISLSDIISEEAEKRGVSLDGRDAKRIFSDGLANEWGREGFAKKALERKNKPNMVISSIRKAEEVDLLKKQNDFTLLFIDTDISIRVNRMKARGRGDEKNLTDEELSAKEDLEMSGKGSQNIGYCKEKADILVDNTGSFEDLYRKIDAIVE